MLSSWLVCERSRSPRSLRISAISDSCLRGWMAQADIVDGAEPGLSSDERAELVKLRRANRVLEMEVEILKRAAAYFARENVLPK